MAFQAMAARDCTGRDGLGGSEWELFVPPKGLSKNREMKEEPTILLITKDRFWEPTMCMKTKYLSKQTHYVCERK